MKVFRKIKKEFYYEVLDLCQKTIGIPFYYEELAIYLNRVDSSVRVLVRANQGVTVSYRDESGKEVSSFEMESIDLKSLLIFLCNGFGELGHISTSPVFKFSSQEYELKLLKTSLHGSILTFKGDSGDFESILNEDQFYSSKEKPEVLDFDSELKIIDFKISSKGILNEKILSYLERNGIPIVRSVKTSYVDLLQTKSNDYTEYSKIFELITGQSMLETSPVEGWNKTEITDTKVSFVVPCYNTEDSIVKVLDSIEYQFKNTKNISVETVLVDDGSDVPISNFVQVRNYSHDVRIVRVEKNVGLSTARKIGFDVAKGDILFFIDSDILLEENYLQEHVVRHKIVPNAVFVSFKENVDRLDARVTEAAIAEGLKMRKMYIFALR